LIKRLKDKKKGTMSIPKYAYYTFPWRGDDEKVATTTTDLPQGVVIEKVSVVSRYGKADELELMLAMVLHLPAHLRSKVDRIFCDSEAGNVFTVMLHRLTTGSEITLDKEMAAWDKEAASEIGLRLEYTVLRCKGLHDGIVVRNSYQGAGEVRFEPNQRPSQPVEAPAL
jgi:hypothetical protein